MLVSIIIPVYNSAQTLPRAIASAIAQDYPNIEIILIDNNSTDNSLNLITEAVKKYYPKIKATECKTQGCSAARNHGINISNGDWVQFLDADDTLEPNKISTQISLVQPETKWIVSPFYNIYDDGSTELELPLDDLWKGLVYEYRTGYTCSNLYHISALQSVGYWNQELPDNTDPDLHFKLLKNNLKNQFVQPALTNYYQHNSPKRLSLKSPVNRLERRVEMLIDVNSFLRNNRCEYWKKNRAYFLAALLSAIRFLATYDLNKANTYYINCFKVENQLTQLKNQPILSNFIIFCYRFIGFKTTEYLRKATTRFIPNKVKALLKRPSPAK